MSDLVLRKLNIPSTQAMHSIIADVMNIASLEADIAELKAINPADKESVVLESEIAEIETRLPSEIAKINFDKMNYGIGLIMEKELWLSAPKDKIDTIEQLIMNFYGAVKWQ